VTIWIDGQLDPKLAIWLGTQFKVIAKPIREIGLRNAEDDELFQAARRFNDIVILTKDYDFVELVQRLGAPPQIIWLRCPNMGTRSLQAKLAQNFGAALERISAGDPLVEILISRDRA
jgi:predicted nuclease of predicted toxin-antitoxin system